MNVPNRAALIAKTYKVLKKHFQPVVPPSDRSLLEHVLYACCLENARHDVADEAFAKLQEMYFDWNEVRVTTVAELTETMASHPDAAAAAARFKKILQSVFESHYAFDIEFLKKENIGVAVKRLEKYEGATPFAVAYVTQVGLGGHAIGTDRGTLDALYALGIISEAEANDGRVPGMERAVSKSKGIEFASLLHQLGAEFYVSPHATRVRTILLEIAPDAKDRLPKRGAKKPAELPPEQPPAKPEEAAPPAAEPAKRKPGRPRKTPAKAAEKTKGVAKSNGAKKKSTTKRLAKKKPR